MHNRILLQSLTGALAAILLSGTARSAVTVTFTADDSGTHPGALKFDEAAKTLTVVLDALPRDATLFRAELALNPPVEGRRPAEPTLVFPEGHKDQLLKFVAPRFTGLDALAAVQAARAANQPLILHVPSTCNGIARLEVSHSGRAKLRAGPLRASDLRVAHRAGQSLITFREPKLVPLPVFKTGGDVARFASELRAQHPGTTFRVWRSSVPIGPETIATAQLVGECRPLTAWNADYHQGATERQPPVRYRVTDGGEPVAWGTGIYAHNPAEAGRAHYAVSVAINGEEDFSQLAADNTTPQSIIESVGLGEPVFQWKEEVPAWMYRQAGEKHRLVRLVYTRWESGQHSSVPSQPIDYLVSTTTEPKPKTLPPSTIESAFRADPAPVGLHLHCWGGSLNEGYGWWYNAHRGAVLIASNQVPYDWWTGYHEALDTCKTWGDGHVHAYTMNRMFSFLDWAQLQSKAAPSGLREHWPTLDRSRAFVAGHSMGGSGAGMFGVRHGDRLAWSLGWVGVHIPGQSPTYTSSYEGVYGPRDVATTMSDGRTRPWEFFDDVQWLRANPRSETALIIAANGKNDDGIGWPQAVQFARALQETRRPHMFNWNMAGHSCRTGVNQNFDLDVHLDQSLPAFTRCSLDDDLGSGRPLTPEESAADLKRQEKLVMAGKRAEAAANNFDGDPYGALNAHLRWRTDDIVDEPGRWEMTVLVLDSAPTDRCTVDLTPRRLQHFLSPRGEKLQYRVVGPDQSVAAKGEVTADTLHLVTLPQIPLGKGANRVVIEAAR